MNEKSQQFEKLMIDYLSGNLSNNDARELLCIINSDSKYKVLYNEIVKSNALSHIPGIESQRVSNYKLLLKRISINLFSEKQIGLKNYFLRIAAILILTITTSISSYYIYTDYSSKHNMLSYETIVPHGSQSKIILPDGTVVWLNSGSTLKYDNSYGRKNRTVLLTGEGYFDVTKAPNKPFFVYADQIKIKVLGTVFNVRAYSDEKKVEVNLLEGKIDVSLKDEPSLILLPNEEMVYNKRENRIYSYKVDASRSATWISGKLCFVEASLQDISKDLERRYDVKIIIKSQKIKDELFSGSLDLNQPIEKILEYIDVDKKYTRTYNGKEIYIN